MLSKDRYGKYVHVKEAEVVVGGHGYYLAGSGKIVQPSYGIHVRRGGGDDCSGGGEEDFEECLTGERRRVLAL